jgi:hypothetical protein
VDIYWFDVEVGGPVTEDDVEALGDVLTAADGIDASVQAGEQGGRVMFSREAHDAIEAITSAIEHVTAAGLHITGVTEDLVVTEQIAERAKVTPAAVRYWISGERGPGGFPEPKAPRPRKSLYSWAEVSGWLAAAKLGEVDHAAAEVARASIMVNAALTIRNGLPDLPPHDRPLISRILAA